jgi:S-adenosylmethionine/arginine decarboxylase-like enzyme
MKQVYFLFVCLFLFASQASAEETAESWGYHLILNCRGGDVSAVTDPKQIEQFVIELVEQIDMKRFGEATIVHFGSAHLTGYSLMQLIETSSITAHFVDQNGDAYIDIFSCKPFSEETALAVVRKYFRPKNIQSYYLTRQA